MSKIAIGSKVRFEQNRQVRFGTVKAVDGKNVFVREEGKSTVCLEASKVLVVPNTVANKMIRQQMTGRSARKIKIGDTVAKRMKNGTFKKGTVIERHPTKSATDFDVKFYGEAVKRMHYTSLVH